MKKVKTAIKLGVIISSYNNPAWLEKVLWGYMNQSVKADEILIADDGSKEDTRKMIEKYSELLPIKHIWHEDNGYQKCTILNKAILASSSGYLIFTDQDCVPREDFIETHLKFAEKGYFLSGGVVYLPMSISEKITQQDVHSGNAFSPSWLKEQYIPKTFKLLKLTRKRTVANFMNTITPAKATWNGGNASGWKEDILKINGFNEDMQYGGQDREFGERMFNMGIKSKQIRYSAVLLHLDHKRPYKTNESIDKNITIRKNTHKTGIIETPNGIKKISTNDSPYKASVIISIYDNVEFLKAVLDSLKIQTENKFEIIISEDAEHPHVKAFVDSYDFIHDYKHLTQEDLGWQKNKALNSAIKASLSDWLVFIDGDCVLHPRFIEFHVKYASQNYILGGKRVKLNDELSKKLMNDNNFINKLQGILIKKLFFGKKQKIKFLEEGIFVNPRGCLGFIPFFRSMHHLKGCNMSFSKKAAFAINGFDEDYTLPAVGEDYDLMWRFKAKGYKLKSLRNLAVQYHLYHKESWNDQEVNLEKTKQKQKRNEVFCKAGLIQNP